MEETRAILITGAAVSGKTWRANEEAEKRGGHFVTTFWEEIQGRFGLGRVLKSNPQTVIIEGLPVKALSNRSDFIKSLICGDPLIVEEKYQDPRSVEPPFFIFTMLTPVKVDLSPAMGRRFEVIEL